MTLDISHDYAERVLDADDWRHGGIGVRELRNWRAEDRRFRADTRALCSRIRSARWKEANRERHRKTERERWRAKRAGGTR